MARTGKVYYCEKCNKTMSEDQFYTSKNLDKYPNEGKLNQCKKCITMHVDNWNPDTYLWILQEIDVPYVPEEWNKLMATYAKDASKLTGMTILGRYLSKMKLKQWKDYHWKDTEFLQELANSKIEQTMKRQGYEAADIAMAINKASVVIPEGELVQPEYADSSPMFSQQPEVTAVDLGLSEEDVTYLRLKWGKSYKPEEWIQLEQLYEEMMGSYDIQTAGHIDTLKLVCKTSLKANQLLDIGDVDGAQKMIKMYDSLMKSGKFTAQQNKAESGEYVDSISELVAICEKDGFIPRYYTDGPQDKVDFVIKDMEEYVRTLVTEEMHLGVLIEKAVKQIEEDRLKELEQDIDDETEDEALERELFGNEDNDYNTYEDYEDFQEFQEELRDYDADLFRSLLEEE